MAKEIDFKKIADDFLCEVGQRIRYLRIRKGLTQDELAKKMGYTSRSTINKIEKGLVDMPTTKVREFATVLDVMPDFFFYNFGRMEKIPGLLDNNRIIIKTTDGTELYFSATDKEIEEIITLFKDKIEDIPESGLV